MIYFIDFDEHFDIEVKKLVCRLPKTKKINVWQAGWLAGQSITTKCTVY